MPFFPVFTRFGGLWRWGNPRCAILTYMNQQTSAQPQSDKTGGPSRVEKVRGTKMVRLIIIGLLILITAYLLYSVW